MPNERELELGGFTDDLADAGNFIIDKVLPIAEVVLPVIAPVTAPIVAAEHAIRTGVKLTPEQAKKATVAATAVGKAVAATQQGDQEPRTSSTSSEIMTVPQDKGSSTTWYILGGIVVAYLWLSK
jgi:cytochrome c1